MSEGEARDTSTAPGLSHVSLGSVEVDLCEACQWAIEGMDVGVLDPAPTAEPLARLTDYELAAVLDSEAGAHFSWQDCDGCGGLPGTRMTYRVVQ